MSSISPSSLSQHTVTRPMRIGVFDSGVGGLTVLDHLMSVLPAHYVYLGDTAWMPYGEKEPRVLFPRIHQLYQWLVTVKHIDAWVIACNTASMVCQTHHPHPHEATPHIPYVEPIGPVSDALVNQVVVSYRKQQKIAPAHERERDQHVIVLATPKTTASRIYPNTLQNFASQAQLPLSVHSISGEGLGRWIEAGDFYSSDATLLFDQLMQRIQGVCRVQPVSHLILACTHYPHVYQQFVKALPSQIKVLDPAEAMAQQLKDKLINNWGETTFSQRLQPEPTAEYIVTGNPIRFYQAVEKLGLKHVVVDQVSALQDISPEMRLPEKP